jgi:hypothetical protein
MPDIEHRKCAIPVLLGSIVWAVVDAIMMFTGSVKDNYGRKLR